MKIITKLGRSNIDIVMEYASRIGSIVFFTLKIHKESKSNPERKVQEHHKNKERSQNPHNSSI